MASYYFEYVRQIFFPTPPPAPPEDEWRQQVLKYVEPFKPYGGRLITWALEETEYKVIVVARALFDLTVFSVALPAVFMGGCIAAVDIKAAKDVCAIIDGVAEKVWREQSLERKLLSLGIGTSVGLAAGYFANISFLSDGIRLYAAKRGVDIAIRLSQNNA